MGKPAGPRILLYDLETKPNLAYCWAKYEQDVIAFEKEWELLSFAYKWFGEKSVRFLGRNTVKSEKSLVLKLWHLLNKADIVIAHNGNSFDNKKAFAKFIEYNIRPPSKFHSIDTKLIARRYFKFNSNSLKDIANTLKLKAKIDPGGFELWQGCMRGCKRSWAKMERYNKRDVEVLEQIYLRVRPFITNHPHIGLFSDRPTSCPNCGSEKIQSRGYAHTRTSQYTRYQCCNCGSWSRGKARTKTRVETV